MQFTQQCYTRLPLEFACNVRELGGIPCMNGAVTAWHTFLRADDMNQLSENDIQFLIDYGVSTVIDLRSDYERKTKPDLLGQHNEVAYFALPFMKQDLSPEALQAVVHRNQTLGGIYCDLLEERRMFWKQFTSGWLILQKINFYECSVFTCAH